MVVSLGPLRPSSNPRSHSQEDLGRQTREFAAWGTGAVHVGGDKDSLNGRDAAVAGGKAWREKGVKDPFARLFAPDPESKNKNQESD